MVMRKPIPLLVVALSLCISANAKQISSQQAEMVAKKYVATTTFKKKLSRAGSQIAAPYYAFNADNGFVVVSGDDSLTELVCYSDHGSIDPENLPAPLKELLDDYATYVKALQNGSAKAVRTTTSTDPTVIVSPMVTTKWNQDAPYNNMVPTDCATGCAATALAQVLNYHKWPDTGVGTNTYTDRTYGTMTMDFSKSTYDWDNMIDEYVDGQYTEAQGNAVAKLMLDCGMAINMQYGSTSSATLGGYLNCTKFLKYDVQLYNRDDRSTADNIALVTEELNNGRPFIIGAQSLGGGHAFVADGYDSNNFLHINWGWGGLSDAYFNLNYLDPDNQGIGGGSGAFNRDQGFAFFTPLRDGETAKSYTSLGFVDYLDGYGVGCTAASFAKEVAAPFTLAKIYNAGTLDFAGDIAVGIYDSNNNIVARSTEPISLTENPMKAGYYISQTQNLPVNLSSLSDGLYTARGIYCTSANAGDESKWEKFESSSSKAVKIDGGTVYVSTPTSHLYMKQAATLGTTPLGLGHIANFSVTLNNESAAIADGYILYNVYKKSDNSLVKASKAQAIIYDYSDYDTQISVYLNENTFEAGETYVFSVEGMTDTDGAALDFTKSCGTTEFTVTNDEPLKQKQLYLYSIYQGDKSYEAKVDFSSTRFLKTDGSKVLVIGPITNLNQDTFVGKVGYMINKYNSDEAYYTADLETGSAGLPYGRVYGYQYFAVANSVIPELKEGVYSLRAASVEKIDNAYPDVIVPFVNADNYCLDFRVDSQYITTLASEKKIEQVSAVTTSDDIVLDALTTFTCQLENLSNKDVTGTPVICIFDKNKNLKKQLDGVEVTIPAYSKVDVIASGILSATDFNAGETYTASFANFDTEGYNVSANSDYDYSFTIKNSGVVEVNAAAVKVYPNPTVDAIHTSATANRIAVYSLSGALVAEAANTNTLSVAHLASGCYIVAVTTDGNTTRHQIVKK